MSGHFPKPLPLELVPDTTPSLDADLLAMIARYPALRAAADKAMAVRWDEATPTMRADFDRCMAVKDTIATTPARTPEGVLAKLVFACEALGWDQCGEVFRLPLQAMRDAIRVGC